MLLFPCFLLIFSDTLYLVVVVVVVVIVFFCVFVTIVLQKITFFFPMCCCWCCCCCCCLRYLWWRWLKQTLFSQEKLYRNKVHETQNWCKNERELGYKHYPRVVQYLTSWWFLLFLAFVCESLHCFFFVVYKKNFGVILNCFSHCVIQQTIVSRVFNLSPTETLAFSLVALSFRGGCCCCFCCYWTVLICL